MKPAILKGLSLATLSYILMATASQAQPQQKQQPLSSEELTGRSIQLHAVEAAVWGMPAVNFERMLEAVIANGGAANQMLYWSRPVNWKDQALTPNPNTIYFNPFYDTTKGPVVLEIPPAQASLRSPAASTTRGSARWTMSGPAGVDQGNGGKYLITPPGYEENAAQWIHRRAVGYVSGIRDSPLELQERQRRRHRRCSCVREADEVLSAGRKPRTDRLRGCL